MSQCFTERMKSLLAEAEEYDAKYNRLLCERMTDSRFRESVVGKLNWMLGSRIPDFENSVRAFVRLEVGNVQRDEQRSDDLNVFRTKYAEQSRLFCGWAYMEITMDAEFDLLRVAFIDGDTNERKCMICMDELIRKLTQGRANILDFGEANIVDLASHCREINVEFDECLKFMRKIEEMCVYDIRGETSNRLSELEKAISYFEQRKEALT